MELNMKKLTVFVYLNALLCILYSFFSISFHADVSLLAFPLCIIFTGFVVYFSIFDLLRKNTIKHIGVVRELVSYEPFVFITCFIIQRAGKEALSFNRDLICAILWVCVLIVSFILKNRFLSEKNFPKHNKVWAEEREKNPLRKPKGLKRLFYEIAETVDAVVWAVFVIAIVNLFIVQLYRIPSESMVPTFLIGDRAIVWKTAAGPKFPLSEVGLPRIQNYNRGDIVVFRNPHYKDDRKSEVKNYLANFLYMISFTLIKANTDENGDLKADPLVKRIAGVPGDQLIMMDGILYARNKDDLEFKPVESDVKHAAWNLNTLSNQSKSKIQWIPLTQEDYNITLAVEEERRNLDLFAAYNECVELSNKFDKYASGSRISEEEVSEMIPAENRTAYSLFAQADTLAGILSAADGGSQWFRHFMTDWAEKSLKSTASLQNFKEDGSITGPELFGGDLYTDSLFRLNVMVKLAFGRIVLNTLESIELQSQEGDSGIIDELRKKRSEEQSKAINLHSYISRMDQRNMPMFPANRGEEPQFLEKDTFFMMGDNRYNSLDMRHSYTKHLVTFWPADPYSVSYNTNIEQQAVSIKKILGKANYCIWPLSRAGSLKGKVRN